MPTLYNCRHAGDEYRITKFNSDFDVESSYLCTLEECECPAGHRPICRHREMLPKFIARDHIGDEWCYDYDRGGWVQGIPSEAIIAEADENIRDLTFGLEHPPLEPAANLPLNSPPPLELAPQAIVDGLPEGVTFLNLEDSAATHNAIADALGEPRIAPPPTIRRRV